MVAALSHRGPDAHGLWRDPDFPAALGHNRLSILDLSEAGADRFYNKVGLYRDRWKEPMTMYLDNYTLGDSFEGVDPSTFDRRP